MTRYKKGDTVIVDPARLRRALPGLSRWNEHGPRERTPSGNRRDGGLAEQHPRANERTCCCPRRTRAEDVAPPTLVSTAYHAAKKAIEVLEPGPSDSCSSALAGWGVIGLQASDGCSGLMRSSPSTVRMRCSCLAKDPGAD